LCTRTRTHAHTHHTHTTHTRAHHARITHTHHTTHTHTHTHTIHTTHHTHTHTTHNTTYTHTHTHILQSAWRGAGKHGRTNHFVHTPSRERGGDPPRACTPTAGGAGGVSATTRTPRVCQGGREGMGTPERGTAVTPPRTHPRPPTRAPRPHVHVCVGAEEMGAAPSHTCRPSEAAVSKAGPGASTQRVRRERV
jgi:hypothetical protein